MNASSLPPVILGGLIFAPLLAALCCWIVPSPRFGHALAIALSLLLLAALAPLSTAAIGADGLRLALGGHPAPLGIELAVDGLTLTMLWLAQIIAFAVNVYLVGWRADGDPGTPPPGAAAREPGRPDVARLLQVCWLVLWGGLNGLFLSADLFNLYVCLEITTLAGVALVVAAGGPSLPAAMRYLQFALVGSIFYLLGVALVYAETGTLALRLLTDGALLQDSPAGITAVLAITLGVMIKAALFPLHGWLVPAHSAAPAPASAILSALVVQAAAYLLLRLWFGPFSDFGNPLLAQGLGAVGLAGIVYASLQALRQQRLKLIIAYSTVAQSGYLLLLLPLASLVAWQGVLYHALSHGIAKAAMFLAAGNVIRAIGNDRLENLAGMDRVLSGNLLVIAIAGISLAGLPPSGGFIGKWWLVSAALTSGQWWWAIGVIGGGFLAAAYVFRILHAGTRSPDSYSEVPLHRAGDLPASLLWPPYLLALLALVLGFGGNALAPLLLVDAPAGLRP